MKSSNLLKTRKKLLVQFESLAHTMMIGSLHETTVNCKIESCKKCANGKRGHTSYRLGYKGSNEKRKVVYVRKNEFDKIKMAHKQLEEAKKIMMDIAEINFLIMKENR